MRDSRPARQLRPERNQGNYVARVIVGDREPLAKRRQGVGLPPLPPRLCEIVDKAIHRDVEPHYSTAEELRQALLEVYS